MEASAGRRVQHAKAEIARDVETLAREGEAVDFGSAYARSPVRRAGAGIEREDCSGDAGEDQAVAGGERRHVGAAVTADEQGRG